MRVAFDIDDTLWEVIRNKESKMYGMQVPDHDLIQVLRWFYKNGDDVFVWSAGGLDYAQQIVEKIGLADMVTVIRKVALHDPSNPHKIDIAFDDEETKLAKVDVIVKRL